MTIFSRLKSLIHKVEQGQDVNLTQLLKEIDKLNLNVSVHPTDIIGVKSKGGHYTITHFKPELLRTLQALVNDVGNDRISAALQNQSHRYKVDGSFLLIRQHDSHPHVVIMSTDNSYVSSVQQTRYAIVVENRQLFLFPERFMTFLQKYTDVPLDQPIDIIFGTGNELPNSLHARFLSAYDHLYLCLDFDLGGLLIANNLIKLLPTKSISFVHPHDIHQRLEKVICVKHPDYLQSVAKFAVEASPLLKQYALLIRSMGRTIEQESYLA